MGQKVSGGMNRTNSRDGSVTVANQFLPEHYRRALAAAAAAAADGASTSAFGNLQGADCFLALYQDFVRPSRFDVILTLPPLPKEIQVCLFVFF